jgi:hypothetical protein
MIESRKCASEAPLGGKHTTGRAAIVVTAAALLLTACSGSDMDGPVIKVTSGFDTTQASMGVTVQLIDGCLRSDDSVLVWPEDTTWDQANEEVVREDGTRIPMGTEITINSYALPDLEKILGKDGAHAAEACGGVSIPTGEEAPAGLPVRVA